MYVKQLRVCMTNPLVFPILSARRLRGRVSVVLMRNLPSCRRGRLPPLRTGCVQRVPEMVYR